MCGVVAPEKMDGLKNLSSLSLPSRYPPPSINHGDHHGVIDQETRDGKSHYGMMEKFERKNNDAKQGYLLNDSTASRR
jgi:hypothetical protein